MSEPECTLNQAERFKIGFVTAVERFLVVWAQSNIFCITLVDTVKSETASSHRKDSASFPKPILKRTVQGQSSISHSRKVRFPSPDIEAASAKRRTSRVGGRHNPQPFQWMAKRPRKKARVVDIDRLLEEEEGVEEIWDDVEMIDNPEGRQHDKRKEIAEEPSIILQEK